MFAKLASWIRSLFAVEEQLDYYKPSQVRIYRYWDGQKMVAADPLVLYKKVMAVGPELAIDMQMVESDLAKDKDQMMAHDKMIEKTRGIFGVKSLAEGGLDEVSTKELLDHFLTYCEAIKKNSSPTQTSAASQEDGKPLQAEVQPIQNSSVSGLTVGDLSIEQLPPSPSVRGLQSGV